MALKLTNIIDPYVPWTGWGDYAVNDDVNAITVYIENQRPKIKEYPNLQTAIEQYESWLTNLSWFEKYMTPNDTLGKAVWYRDWVNDIIGSKLDPTWVPADIENKIVAVDPAKPTDFLGQFIPDAVSSSIKKALFITLAIATGGTIIYLFGPAIRKIASAKAEEKFSKKETPKEIPS